MAKMPYTSAAPDPRAIRLSMFGLRCANVLNPTEKNFRFTYRIGNNSKNCVNAKFMALALPCIVFTINSGTGIPNHSFSIWCIDTYINGIRNPMEIPRRHFMALASASSFCCSSCLPSAVDFPVLPAFPEVLCPPAPATLPSVITEAP